MTEIRFSRKLWIAAALAIFSPLVPGAFAQKSTVSPVRYSWMPNQITASWIYTRDDYSVADTPATAQPGSSITNQQASSIPSQLITLSGFNLEYAYRKYYPWEVVGTFRRESGNPLGQVLTTYAAGAGYIRQFGRYAPFGHLLVGVSRTGSSNYQYLFASTQTGFTSILTGGVDVRLRPRWGARAFVENQYLPFGSSGSVYWSAGAGIFFRFEPQH